jgi:hypothetical protein
MFTLSPCEYIKWLTGIKGMDEEAAKVYIEKLYLKQTGKYIRMFLIPYKNSMIWDYELVDSNNKN